jgi:hypothetical protein
MTPAVDKPPLLASTMEAPTPGKALRRLFLTLFLRGRTSRGLTKKGAPKTIGQKIGLILLFYALFGCVAISMIRQPVFALAIYLHGMTFAFLGMFIASSAGEVLFNKEEADILLHRPVDSKTMLWSKIYVLVEVSLWIAGAFNLAGLFAGLASPDGGWRFPLVHALSTAIEALFCTACVVLAYQLCLRWFGRERLEGLMTTTQVLVSVAFVLGSQILPRLIFRFGGVLTANDSSWWFMLLPPTWFAGFDDALAGSHARLSWVFGLTALVATGMVLWLAFGKLADTYERGLQKLEQTVTKPKSAKKRRRWLTWLITMPPLGWWSREPVSRAAFLLTTAYLIRDRDVKLRVYPGIAPMLIFPFLFLFQNGAGMGSLGIALCGGYLGLIPLIAMSMLQYSQQWQASDIFRVAPMRGPAAIYHGARRTVLLFITLPILLILGLLVSLVLGLNGEMLLLLPGVIALPVYSMVPGIFGRAIPLSTPIEEAKSAKRGVKMLLALMISMFISAIASTAWSHGWFWPFLAAEILLVIAVYAAMRLVLANLRWKPAE